MEWLGMEDPDWQKKVFTLLGVVIGLILLISLLLAWRNRAPRPDRAAILYRKFVKKTGIPQSLGESPASFAGRAHSESSLPSDTIDTITSAYLAARYGFPDAQALQQLEMQVRQL